MGNSHFKLRDFSTEVLSGLGLARTNRFEVYVLPPPILSARYGAISNAASLYVEQASFPLLNIASKPFKIFGPTYQRPITSEYGGEGIPITFNVDRNMKIKEFFDEWMHSIINPNTFTVSYQEDYTSTIVIKQLDENEDVVYEVELLEAFPRNLNLMDLNNSSSNQTHRLNVLFAYRYWRRPVNSQSTDVPRDQLNPQVPLS